MKGKGFYMFQDVLKCKFMDSNPVEVVDVVRDSKDDLLDLIFSIDARTGFPQGALQAYLSDKTNTEVREFISSKLLQELPDNLPTGKLLDFIKEDVDTDFLANVCRNRFESVESYEERLNSYFKKFEDDKQYQANLAKLKKRLSSQKSD